MTRAALPVLAALALALPVALHAQTERRGIEAELSASLFFGNVSQTLATMRTAYERRDSSFAFRTEARFNYGETEDDAGDRSVSRRSWLGSVNVDWRPYAPSSQFLIATVESSFEKRIDLRYSGGLGHKVALIQTDRSTMNFGLALLAERTLAAPSPTGTPNRSDLLARWAASFVATHDLSDRMEFRTETAYRPQFDAVDRFTFSSSTSIGYRAASFLQLRLSFRDNYDSEARQRGARTNNEGELVIGVLTEF